METGKLEVGCMKSQLDIEKLAKQKLAAAKCLLANEHYNDAYYLAGYSIELYLKAMICKTLRVDGFFSFDKMSKENYRPFKTHNYKILFLFSGLNPLYEVALGHDEFAEKWARVKLWNENSRYECDQDPEIVKKFVQSTEELCVWIQKHL